MPTAKIRVLMVDDNEEHIQLCREHLAEERFELDAALSGRECLARLGADPYDIVILDYSLPDMTGLELLKRIRAGGFVLPVVFVSAQNDPDLSMKAMKAGACDYIVKTFKYYDGLQRRIEENIEACTGCNAGR